MNNDLKLKEQFRLLFEKLAPDIYAMPVEAKVIVQHPDDYTIDVLVLDAAGEPNEAWPPIERIGIDKLMASADGQSGFYTTIEGGRHVRVAFYEGDRNRPYLDAVINEFGDNPDLTGVYYWIKTRNTGLKVSANRNIEFYTTDADFDIVVRDNSDQPLARVRLKADGKIEIGKGATKGAARVEDPIISTTVEEPTFWAWLTGFAEVIKTWLVAPNDGGLALQTAMKAYLLANTVPAQLEGKVESGSATVTIDD